ncbi:MAG: hypothetical protein R3A13_09600 [Bdellovibrionota bacterium]
MRRQTLAVSKGLLLGALDKTNEFPDQKHPPSLGSFYNDHLKALVAEIYAEDIRRFGLSCPIESTNS